MHGRSVVVGLDFSLPECVTQIPDLGENFAHLLVQARIHVSRHPFEGPFNDAMLSGCPRIEI
jgi:hypothetical protein